MQNYFQQGCSPNQTEVKPSLRCGQL